MNPLLLFHATQRETSRLIEGRLLLIDKASNSIVEKYIVTSGLPGWQDDTENWIRARGAIPPQEQSGIDYYTVETKPIYLPNVRGVEGNFFKILPFQIQSKSGKSRSDFGIHFDANVPGSAGCIVVRNHPAWQVFEKRMKGLRTDLKIAQVPLLISYVR